MKKLKIYLDATIPNYAFNSNTPEKQKSAKKLFEGLKSGKFEAYISEVIIDEISDALEPKRTKMLKIIEDIPILSITEECNILAEKYITEKVIPIEHKEDALHIAISTYYGLDALISYNFEHIVKLKTIREVEGINRMMGYKTIDLIIPEEVLNE